MPKYRKYTEIKHNLLLNTNNSMSVYWLGFIAADGAIVKSRLNITLAAKDLDHIQKFKKQMLLENPIKKVEATCNTITKIWVTEYNNRTPSVLSYKLLFT